MPIVASVERNWELLADRLARAPRVAMGLILAATAAAVTAVLLTPDANAPAAPFVLPPLLATFQRVRWVWISAVTMIPLYALVAFALQSVPISSGLTNIFGLVIGGFLISMVAEYRQRATDRANTLTAMEQNFIELMRISGIRAFCHDCNLRYSWVPNLDRDYASGRMLGVTDEELFSPEDAATIMAIKRRALDEERAVHEEITLTIDGIPRIFDLTIMPAYSMVDGREVKIGITCVSYEVTRLKQGLRDREALVSEQEEMLVEATRAQENLERFMSLIAHDLVQPLTVIQGYIDVLRRRLDRHATEQQRRALDALSRSVTQMTRLIDDLRDVAALEQGRFSLDIRPVDLIGIIREVASDFQSTTEVHRINLHAPEQLWGHMDSARVSQLIGNLLSNAVKYSPDGGDIDVSVDVARNSCVIRVSDHGLGMPPEELNFLFEMFSRLENSRSIQGLGLGLYISKGIVEAHSGSIHAVSDPGKGSEFSVTLPLTPRVSVEMPLRTQASRPERQQVCE
jgi:signal transduction histidine kinase